MFHFEENFQYVYVAKENTKLISNVNPSQLQVNDGLVLPDKASLYLTAIEDAEYKDDKIECELLDSSSTHKI